MSPPPVESLRVGAHVLRCRFFPPAQPLHISGDVTKCLLKAGEKVQRGEEPGKAGHGAPMAFEQQSCGQPPKARLLSSLLVLQASTETK